MKKNYTLRDSRAVAQKLVKRIDRYQGELERRKKRTAAENRHLLAIRTLASILTNRQESI